MKLWWLALFAAGCIGKPDRPGGPRVWKKIPVADQPGTLDSPRLTYDPGTRSVVLFAGIEQTIDTSAALKNQMWQFDGATWNEMCHACLQPARAFPGFASDNGRLVLVAGTTDTAGHELVAETDVYANGQWSPLATTGTGPGERNFGQLVSFRGALWSVGGYNGADNNGQSTRDTYVLSGSTWMPLAAPNMDATFAGDAQIIAADDDHDRIVAVVDNAGNGRYDEVWSFDGTWKMLCDDCTGMPRTSASIVHIDGADLTLLLGGDAQSNDQIAGTWVLNSDGTTFSRYDDGPGETPFPARSSFGVAYDPERDIVVVYGGDECQGAPCAETWVLAREP